MASIALKKPERNRDRSKQWLSELEQLLIDANQSHRSTASLWELDEFQLGEAAASTFAYVDVDFVPYYTRLLQVWDMDHEVSVFDTVKAIVERHGICPETEELLMVRASKAIGQMGHDQFIELMPVLETHYGDFKKTRFHALLEWD